MTTPPPRRRETQEVTTSVSATQPQGMTALVKDTKPAAGRKRTLTPSGPTAKWLQDNKANIAEADRLIGIALADKKHFCDHTNPETHAVCDDIFTNVLQSGVRGCENNSVLLLGEAGSGKTHVVERCLKDLLVLEPCTVVLRARGGAYATDVQCLRHLATQISDNLEYVPHANASFKAGMDWMKGILKASFKQSRAMVMVLDQFEYFCSRARQTLLYTLFDIAQEAGVSLSVIGMSEKMDVMNHLEKRIKSRFSMRFLHMALPTTMDGLVQVLMARLKLPPKCGLQASFLNQFTKHVENALFAKRSTWKPLLDNGMAPSHFLAQCLPVASLLSEACSSEPPLKKRSLTTLPSCTDHQAKMLLVDGLAQDDHIVLIGLYRLRSRGLPRTLSTVLHEIQLLHQMEGQTMLTKFNTDFWSAAFNRLLTQKLVELPKNAPADTAKRHLPCSSSVDRLYDSLIKELGRSEPAQWYNPLRQLPQSIQQWASVQRAIN